MKNILQFAKGIAFVALAMLLVTCGRRVAQDPEEESSPNLIVILTDDLGYGDVGFNGCKDIPTPNIDKIAQNGVRCTNAYVSYPVCGPSRAGLITGRYQGRFGFRRNPLFAPNDPSIGVPLSEEILSEALSKANYKSVALGKWHLGAHPTLRPLERGFNDFFGFLSGGHRYFPEEWVLADEFEAKAHSDGYRTKLLRNDKRIEEKEYLTDALSREAVSYIKEYKDDPFFVYLAYNAPHAPLQATDKYLSRFEHITKPKRKVYAAMVSAVDDGVGLILDQLDSLGLTENTIVVFLSDNGGPELKNGSDNGVLRGGKGNVFEGGIRVPFAMQWPGVIPAEQVYDQPVISLDIFATIVGQNNPVITTRNDLDGVDLIPYLRGEKEGQPHDALYWSKFDDQQAVVRSGDDKLIINAKKKQASLYNLRQDISEENNLIKAELDKKNALQQRLDGWCNLMKDPAFLGLKANKKYDKENINRFKRSVNEN